MADEDKELLSEIDKVIDAAEQISFPSETRLREIAEAPHKAYQHRSADRIYTMITDKLRGKGLFTRFPRGQ